MSESKRVYLYRTKLVVTGTYQLPDEIVEYLTERNNFFGYGNTQSDETRQKDMDCY